MIYLVGPLTNIERMHEKIAQQVQDSLNDGVLVEIDIKPAKNTRTHKQNRMQFQWYLDAEKQGDQTAQEYRAYAKLHHGVPILRSEDEGFRAIYDQLIRPLEYEDKLKLMMEPIDFPVTSRMTVKQKGKYLDEVRKDFESQGFVLTEPEEEL